MKRKGKKLKPSTPSKGRLPENKVLGSGLVKSESQKLSPAKQASARGADRGEQGMDAYASRRMAQIAKNRKQAAR